MPGNLTSLISSIWPVSLLVPQKLKIPERATIRETKANPPNRRIFKDISAPVKLKDGYDFPHNIDIGVLLINFMHCWYSLFYPARDKTVIAERIAGPSSWMYGVRINAIVY
ncbi:hypothetical protein [Desulfocurvibacter africanus]|uniref:hypothetical protein n=1 Tax=Desulfocurvibacter africanus TaxID=873 RepID=UPI001ED9182E|nr:hypothetical protein [Desulfocurvibacter africanus]